MFTFKNYWQIAIQELRNQRRLSILFALSLSTGLIAFTSVGLFRGGLQSALSAQSRSLLGSDISISARRPITDAEKNRAESKLPVIAKTSTIETYSMVATKTTSRLVELKAIGPGYPFYGQIKLETGVAGPAEYASLQSKNELWLYPDLMLQLGLKLGDTVQIGHAEFDVAHQIVQDSAGLGGGFSFAPTLYLSLPALSRTNLIRQGSTAAFEEHYKLSDSSQVQELAETLFKSESELDLRVNTPKNASEQVGRMLNYLSDYLGLASLIAVFLTAFGCIYLYRSYLAERVKEIALLKILGLKENQVQNIYYLHAVLLSATAFIPMAIAIYLFAPLFTKLTQMFIGMTIEFSVSPLSLAGALALSVATGFLTAFPLVRELRFVSPRGLLANVPAPGFTFSTIKYYVPLAVAYAIASVVVSQSFKISGLFLASLVGAGGVYLLLSQIVLWILKLNLRPKLSALQWMSRRMLADAGAFRSLFISLSFGVLLTQLLPQVETGIMDEISFDNFSKPTLFLFDVQEDQVKGLETLVTENSSLVQMASPMIRARLELLNGAVFKKGGREGLTREEEQENRSRNRGFNLSYREDLSPSEKIVEGRYWDKAFEGNGLPEMSVETRFADRLGLKMGDILTFDVQGVPVEGRITSLRKVKWTSFQPNFFVQVQPGPLDDAPKTFVISVGQANPESKIELQKQIVKKFPSVSIIDVSQLLSRIADIVLQMAFALRSMALLALLVGLLIFYAILSRQVFEKRFHSNLLKALGASRGYIIRALLGESILVSLSASLVGSVLAIAFSYAMAHFVFDSAFKINWTTWFAVLLTFNMTCILISWLGLRRVFNSKPQDLLQESSGFTY